MERALPDLAILTKDVEAETVYVYVQEKGIVGCVMFSTTMDDFYRDIVANPKHKQLYVHRLAVHPEQQGKLPEN